MTARVGGFVEKKVAAVRILEPTTSQKEWNKKYFNSDTWAK
jgi:hypothetical protein